MKKFPLFQFLFCLCAFVLISNAKAVFGQVSNPSAWSSLIANDTILHCDTILRQTFNQRESDNWNYVSQNTSINSFITRFEIKPNGFAMFDALPSDKYNSTRIDIYFGFSAFNSSQKFCIFKSPTDSIIIPNNKEFYSIVNHTSPLLIRYYNPLSSNYLFLRRIFALGFTKCYSLFSGAGSWTDSSSWSSLSPIGNRHALINGNVNVDSCVYCSNVSLFNGSINVSSGDTLSVDTLSLHEHDISITGQGSIQISNSARVYKTFENKGSWYFVSFPFDVYKEEIDSDFQMADDTPNSGGNYFYVIKYDGAHRSSNNEANNNWSVLDPSDFNDENPVFKKGFGYLVAIDELAQKDTMFFNTTALRKISPGEEVSLEIEMPSYSSNTSEQHKGWVLCGNPLFSYLPLKNIVDNGSTDGNVYCFDGEKYVAYNFDSDYSLPPFTSFFIKSNRTDILTIRNNSQINKSHIIKNCHLRELISISEPNTNSLTNTNVQVLSEEKANQYHLYANNVYLTNMTSSGTLFVYDLLGRQLSSHKFSIGNSLIRLDVETGLYIIRLKSNIDISFKSFIRK